VIKATSATNGMGAPTPAQSATLTSYFTFLSENLPSSASTAHSSRRSLNSAHNSESRCSPSTTSSSSSTFSSRRSWSPNALRANANAAEEEDGNVWGHHVDPAEAEAEVIRHSKILSRRAAAVMMY
jgi:hypothetical protein